MTNAERAFLNWLNTCLDSEMDSEEEAFALAQTCNPALQRYGASIPHIILASIKYNRAWHPLMGD